MVRSQLELPPGVPVGLVIGRRGRHVVEAQQQTGAHINVDARRGTITASGSAAAVAAAEAFYRRWFAAGCQVAPTESATLLAPPLAGGARFVPVPPDDEAAAALEVGRKPLYALAPVTPPGAALAHQQAATAGAAGVFSAAAPLPPITSEAAGGDAAARRLAAAMAAALRARPASITVKLRCNLGRQFFAASRCGGNRGSPAGLGALALEDLQELTIGSEGSVQGYFSNAFPLARLPTLTARLQELGFQRVGAKRRLALHLYSRTTFQSRAISFELTADLD